MIIALISAATVLAGYYLGRWSLIQQVRSRLCVGQTALITCNLWAMYFEEQDPDVRMKYLRQIQVNAEHMLEEMNGQ